MAKRGNINVCCCACGNKYVTSQSSFTDQRNHCPVCESSKAQAQPEEKKEKEE